MVSKMVHKKSPHLSSCVSQNNIFRVFILLSFCLTDYIIYLNITIIEMHHYNLIDYNLSNTEQGHLREELIWYMWSKDESKSMFTILAYK